MIKITKINRSPKYLKSEDKIKVDKKDIIFLNTFMSVYWVILPKFQLRKFELVNQIVNSLLFFIKSIYIFQSKVGNNGINSLSKELL